MLDNKDANTHSEYVKLIAFPRQQWLRERASRLRYAFIVCLVYISMFESDWLLYVALYLGTLFFEIT
jgi:hypothetical protein